MTNDEAKELAEAHWAWVEKWLHLVFVDGMVHGIKHSQAAAENTINLATMEIRQEAQATIATDLSKIGKVDEK